MDHTPTTPRHHVSEIVLPPLSGITPCACLDQLFRDAVAMAKAEGLTDFEFSVSSVRFRDGRTFYSVSAYDGNAGRNPLDLLAGYAMGANPAVVLHELAAKLAVYGKELARA